MKIFFSYSHHDEAIRNELEVHLVSLKRQGHISTWHDRRIAAGEDFANSIDQNLEDSDVILLLVSPHFIASDYCYEIEMRRAMERQEAGEARVIPVIVEHCLWHGLPFGKLLAVPKDGTPVSKFPNPNEALSEIAGAIADIAKEIGVRAEDPSESKAAMQGTLPSVTRVLHPRSSNLRVTQSFSEKDRDDFLDGTFDYIAKFFQASLAELDKRNDGVESKFKRVDATRFEAKVFKVGDLKSQCCIWRSSRHGDGIKYSSGPNHNHRQDSWSESMSICDDGQSLLLKPMNMAFRNYGQQQRDHLSEHGAAEYFWEMLIEPLQRSC